MSSSLTSIYLYSKLHPFNFIPFGFCTLVLETSHILSISEVLPDVTFPGEIHIMNAQIWPCVTVPNTRTFLEKEGPALAEVAATSFKMRDLKQKVLSELVRICKTDIIFFYFSNVIYVLHINTLYGQRAVIIYTANFTQYNNP